MFNLFDIKKTNSLDFNTFATNLLKLYSTDFNIRMKFIF